MTKSNFEMDIKKYIEFVFKFWSNTRYLNHRAIIFKKEMWLFILYG